MINHQLPAAFPLSGTLPLRRFHLPALLGVVALGILASGSFAERPPIQRKEADAVVNGTVTNITARESAFLSDGIKTTYVAKVTVDKVDKNNDIKAGDVINVSWFHVTTRPSRPTPGAYGHAYHLKKGDRAKFWLLSAGKDWEIIYNSDGVEKHKK